MFGKTTTETTIFILLFVEIAAISIIVVIKFAMRKCSTRIFIYNSVTDILRDIVRKIDK